MMRAMYRYDEAFTDAMDELKAMMADELVPEEIPCFACGRYPSECGCHDEEPDEEPMPDAWWCNPFDDDVMSHDYDADELRTLMSEGL